MGLDVRDTGSGYIRRGIKTSKAPARSIVIRVSLVLVDESLQLLQEQAALCVVAELAQVDVIDASAGQERGHIEHLLGNDTVKHHQTLILQGSNNYVVLFYSS